jgi:LruC domain-containing protein
MNAQRQVVGLSLDYRLDARGGLLESGFGINLPGIPAAAIALATLSTGSGTAIGVGVEKGQAEATFVITSNVINQMPFAADGACAFANTLAACPQTPVVPYHLELSFTTPRDSTQFSAPYNPFIFRTANRGQEVHLAGKAPTTLADKTLFGSADDRTKTGTTTTYMDAQRRPWALDIPANFAWPLESTDLLKGYPSFAAWAKSGGTTSANWYVSPVAAYVYQPK